METRAEKRHRTRENIGRSIAFDMSERASGRFENLLKEGFGVDISKGGIGLITDQPLKKGDVLKLLYPVIDVTVIIPVYTAVMWSNPVEGGFRVGLRFLA